MTRTVDLVIVGADEAAIGATIAALREGKRVLVVIRQAQAEVTRHLRHSLRQAGAWAPGQVSVVSGAEVACVDGVNGIEAVVLRDIGTGRLTGVNASALAKYGDGMKGLIMLTLASGVFFAGPVTQLVQVVLMTMLHVGLMMLSVL